MHSLRALRHCAWLQLVVLSVLSVSEREAYTLSYCSVQLAAMRWLSEIRESCSGDRNLR
jgi:hypothetical protein